MAFTETDAARPAARGSRGQRQGVLLRTGVMLGLLVLSVWLLEDEIGAIEADAVLARLHALSPAVLAGSVLLTCISFLAIGCYDVLALRQMGLAVPPRVALRVGITALGLAQMLGFGLVIGTLVRWRMHRGPGFGVAEAGLASILVMGGFFGGLAVLLSVLALADPAGLALLSGLAEGTVQGLAALGLAVTAAVLALSVLGVSMRLHGRTLRLPPVRFLAAQIGLAAADVVPAALALYLLLPQGIGVTDFVPVFCVALAAGLLSNAPGGLGLFEITLFAGLPGVPDADLIAALIAYRAIYHGLPFVVALGLLAASEAGLTGAHDIARVEPSPRRLGATRPGQVPSAVRAVLAGAARAESQLALLGDKEFLVSRDGRAFLMLREAGGSLIVMGDPVGPRAAWPGLIAELMREAAARFLRPAFYRTGPEAARILARFGFSADLIGHEAVVDATGFSLDGAERRELRRKCRQSAAAGVTLHAHAPGHAPLDRLADLSAVWQADRGAAETGFSMGRFLPSYLSRFPVLEARGKDGTCLGFLSLWQSGDGREQSLDLMRVHPDAPQGTMHALVAAAIEAARAAGAERFSLCMAPLAGLSRSGPRLLERIGAWAFDRLAARHGAPGLARFKQAFRPVWEPRYLVSRAALLPVFEAIDVRRAITSDPDPERSAALPAASDTGGEAVRVRG